ncbi:RNA-directed DNA polymerase [Streptomyces mirabilis]|uniref:RNA-directed DNA polymerase n=1 Tax=Streptomyces mirabilis TaxID=68239 RepID=UPI0036B87973
MAYLALVEDLGDDLGPKSREEGKYKEFKAFTLNGESDYVANFDIASFYEYIDHLDLKREVLSRTLNPESVTKLENVLTSVAGGTRGLPQLLSASDHLADAYIARLERRLTRDGYSVARYVDDFAVACPDWETANVIIERAAEYARDLGMVLSSEKTTITKRATVVANEEAEEKFFKEKFDAARAEEEVHVFLWSGDYDDVFEEDDESDAGESEDSDSSIDDAAMRTAMWSLLGDWVKLVRSAEPENHYRLESHYMTYLKPALGWLRGYWERIPDDILHEVVFRHPLLLAPACGYIRARDASDYGFVEDPWPTIRTLAIMGRQSPWAKLWLLDTVAQMRMFVESVDRARVMEWVDKQLNDRHEVVRAQAAWAAARHGRLEERTLTDLYTHASPISQPALAACMAKQGDLTKGVVNAITQDGPMMKKAYSWAEKKTSAK